MSKIGRKPVEIPEGVDVQINGTEVKVKGPHGELSFNFKPHVVIKKEDNLIKVEPVNKKDKQARAYWGLTRQLINNMVTGVTKGFEKKLVIEGIGYRAQVQNKKLIMQLGYSHPVEMEIPDDLKVEVEGTTVIKVWGIDKYKVGQYAALIREKRPPDPYKGKGIRYENEVLRLKPGKAGVK